MSSLKLGIVVELRDREMMEGWKEAEVKGKREADYCM